MLNSFFYLDWVWCVLFIENRKVKKKLYIWKESNQVDTFDALYNIEMENTKRLCK